MKQRNILPQTNVFHIIKFHPRLHYYFHIQVDKDWYQDQEENDEIHVQEDEDNNHDQEDYNNDQEDEAEDQAEEEQEETHDQENDEILVQEDENDGHDQEDENHVQEDEEENQDHDEWKLEENQDQEDRELDEAIRRSLNIHTGTQAVREIDTLALLVTDPSIDGYNFLSLILCYPGQKRHSCTLLLTSLHIH